jgi:ribosomal protein S18 acetylase RimI-like enzyme
MNSVETRKARASDLEDIKRIADAERDAFGFIRRAAIRQAICEGNIVVVTVDQQVVGFQHFYHRKRDLQTTLYHKAVLPAFRRHGLATRLVDAVVREAREMGRQKLRLKCPVGLPANRFHGDYGFILVDQEEGKKRKLNVWEYHL